MTLEKTAEIMDILGAAYPRFYRKLSGNQKLKAVELWTAMFVDDGAGIVAAAVKAFIALDEKGFPRLLGR